MTFLELEKRCKKRRLFKFFKIFILIVFIAGAGFYFYTLTGNKKPKTITTVKKDVNKSVKKIVQKTKTVVKKEIKESNKTDKLSLIIDLNISKPKEDKTENKQTTKKETKKIAPKIDSPFVMTAQTLPSYETCIALSKKYYQEGDYNEALKWAKNANTQDKKRAESWIMSAKALYKLGKKQQALKILEIYYNYYKDEKVKRVMGELNESN